MRVEICAQPTSGRTKRGQIWGTRSQRAAVGVLVTSVPKRGPENLDLHEECFLPDRGKCIFDKNAKRGLPGPSYGCYLLPACPYT